MLLPTENDLISEVIAKHLKNGDITREQLVAHAFLLLVAGNATVASMINFGVVTLLQVEVMQLSALGSYLLLTVPVSG